MLPSAAELLRTWERVQAVPPSGRPVSLLALADSPATPAELWELPIGERDSRLLALYENLFGSQIRALVSCPACEEPVELDIEVPDLRAPGGVTGPRELRIAVPGHELMVRLPTSVDLDVVGRAAEVSAARRMLFDRCVLEALENGRPVAGPELPEWIVEAVSERMADADPLADVELALVCPGCGHSWQAPLDITPFLWAEIEEWAARLLRDVHELASAYGWRESDIVSMSPLRRRAYLRILGT